jgi:hypothetical protein
MKPGRWVCLVSLLAANGCASSPSEGSREGVTGTSSVARISQGAVALTRFEPAREAKLEEGECTPSELPDAAGQRLTVNFPNRREPDTSITIVVDPRGALLRYSESRGVPTPSKNIEEMQAQMQQMTRTHIQLDYVTGEAMAGNTFPGQPGRGVRGSVAEFENSAALGDLRKRVDLVRRICSG